MNNSENSLVKHVVHEGNIYIVDFNAPAAVWTYAMPLALWAARQNQQCRNQFPSFHADSESR
ncbi:MAG: hypothetical protein U0103_26265 [Candidatus Obscuribacterales bacterium]|nr:hypothetical protein [Cyanobacteria bacterium SZAS LIN-5]RTL37646.1 MAG: hypothetical protein EKK48_23465 [Candidatus Melainabacteria bacterium]